MAKEVSEEEMQKIKQMVDSLVERADPKSEVKHGFCRNGGGDPRRYDAGI